MKEDKIKWVMEVLKRKKPDIHLAFFFSQCCIYKLSLGFPGGSVVKNQPANAGDVSLIPGSGRSPEEGNGNLLQYSCLGNPVDRGVWWAAVHRETKSQNQLNICT